MPTNNHGYCAIPNDESEWYPPPEIPGLEDEFQSTSFAEMDWYRKKLLVEKVRKQYGNRTNRDT